MFQALTFRATLGDSPWYCWICPQCTSRCYYIVDLEVSPFLVHYNQNIYVLIITYMIGRPPGLQGTGRFPCHVGWVFILYYGVFANKLKGQ